MSDPCIRLPFRLFANNLECPKSGAGRPHGPARSGPWQSDGEFRLAGARSLRYPPTVIRSSNLCLNLLALLLGRATAGV